MKIFTGGIRLVWLMGIVLLLGSILGAGLVFSQPASSPGASAAADPAQLGVIGIGHVDIPGGTTFLHPELAGKVVKVYKADGDEVKQGEMLLSLDSSSQKFQLTKAEFALHAAKQDLADARRLVKDHEHQVKSKKFEVEAARANVQQATSERDIFGDGKSPGMQISAQQIAVYNSKVEAAANKVKALEEAVAILENVDVAGKIKLAEFQLKIRETDRDLAKLAVDRCDLYAPCDGVILRLYATPGDVLNAQSKLPAVHFCANLQRMVRVEVLQEWACKIKTGQLADIEDDTRHGPQWKGKVTQVSGQMDHRRSMFQDPFQYNDVRTLECIVSIESGSAPVLIGQRMRVTIKQGGL